MNSLNDYNPAPNEGDLDWRAFRYASGEMSAAEAATFELLLAEDQTAREAVASAVQVTQAVLTLTPAHVAGPQVSPRRNTWRERVAWMVLGATAACVTLVVSWELIAPRESGEVVLSPEQAREVHRVVALWTDGGVLSADELDAVAPEDAADDDAELVARTSGPLHSVHVPGWLLAAVTPAEVEQGPEDN